MIVLTPLFPPNNVLPPCMHMHGCVQAKPQAILFYRDGVAEGQFQEVLRQEFAAIKRACAGIEEGYNPPVTYIVVQKRHSTRLFPAPGTAAHRSGECGGRRTRHMGKGWS